MILRRYVSPILIQAFIMTFLAVKIKSNYTNLKILLLFFNL